MVAITSYKLLIVDDVNANFELLDAVLAPQGYTILKAANGHEALRAVAESHPDLVLTDIMMPEMDGYELCRRLRAEPAARFLPIVMITGGGDEERTKALEAGADDFVRKPVNQPELLARVASLLRIKQFQDRLEQAGQLAELNRTLETRVQQQVDELQRLSRLRRFLTPQLAQLVLDSGDTSLLESHRRQIAVVFTDLRGFTAFSETAEPEELMSVLREYHDVLGAQVRHYEGTVGFFSGDGLMVFFNDPVPCGNPAERAVRMALAMRDHMGQLTTAWQAREFSLGFSAGIAYGYATLGQVGFEGRHDYTAIGSVVNQASRLCDAALPNQIVISQRLLADLKHLVEADYVGEFKAKGFHRLVRGHNVLGLKQQARAA